MEPAKGPELVSVHDDTVSNARATEAIATRHTEDIVEIVRLEREQMANERAELAAERERMMEEFRQERARLDEERQARITELETDLVQVKADRRERERLEDTERQDFIRAQLNDVVNIVQGQWDECTRKKELMDERQNEKVNRRVEKDALICNLYDMVTRIIEDREAERIRREEERIAAESRPGIERVLEELARQNAEQRELLDQMAESWRNGSARNRGGTLAAVQETSSDQVPGGCLCRATTYAFSKAPQDLPEGFNWEANYVVQGDNVRSNKWAAAHCYCDSCRVSAGALVATWIAILRERFKLQKKGPTTVYRSSNHATREFCSTCGTTLFFHDEDEPEFIDITLASVSVKDLSEYIQVTAHIWLEDAEEQTLRSRGEGLGLAAFVDDGLPRWKRGRGSEQL